MSAYFGEYIIRVRFIHMGICAFQDETTWLEGTITGKRTAKCPICSKVFTRSSTVEEHMVVHTGERPYECSECGKRFTQRCTVNRHIKHSHPDTEAVVTKVHPLYEPKT